MKNNTLDDHLIKITEPPKNWWRVIVWWEKQRLFYNSVLIITATILFLIEYNFSNRNTYYWKIYFTEAVFLGFIVNICYTLGWLLEIWIKKIGNHYPSTAFSKSMFKLGLIISVGITIILGILSITS